MIKQVPLTPASFDILAAVVPRGAAHFQTAEGPAGQDPRQKPWNASHVTGEA